MQPFTFCDLIEHTMFKEDIAMVIQATLGSHFSKWFSQATPPTGTVPRQVAILFKESLERLKSNWEEQEAVKNKLKEEAAGSYSAMIGTVRRRRAIAVDEDMD